jgi:SMC interacting uncharacterized protein involved in chromosome segregation
MEDNTIKLMEIRIAELEKLVKFQQSLMWGADASEDIASVQAAADAMSEDVESYRKEVEYLRARARVAYEEIDILKERKQELERTILSQAIELSYVRGLMNSERNINRMENAHKNEENIHDEL